MNNNDESYKNITDEENEEIVEEIMEDTLDENDHHKIPKYFLVMGICLCLFLGSYLAFSKIMNSTKIKSDEDKEVVNSINSNYMSDSTEITLNTQNNEKKEVDKQGKLSELANELGLGEDVTKEELVNKLREKGYELENVENNHYTFNKDTRETLEPNKYYIGTKGEYLAVYKTDGKGKAFIEDDKDVFTNYKTIDLIREESRKDVETFKMKYDTKDKALEDISALLS